MLENVRKSHPKRKEPLLMDLARELPSLRDLQLSFNKLRELCAPGNIQIFINILVLIFLIFINTYIL